MSARRPLGEMLTEVAADTLEAAAAGGIRVRRVEVSLPVEIALRHGAGGVDLLGELPRTLTRTPFDTRPGRLEILWEEVQP